MTPTSQIEHDKYARVWREPNYRINCHALTLWQDFRYLFPNEFKSGLDIGCGLGLILPIWKSLGVDAWGVDLVPNCLDDSVRDQIGRNFILACLWEMKWDRVFDIGVCADVMEHIPPQYVDEVLRRIALCCKEVVFKIDHIESRFIGETLHLTIQPISWWVARMESIAGDAKHVGMSARGGGVLGSVIHWRIR